MYEDVVSIDPRVRSEKNLSVKVRWDIAWVRHTDLDHTDKHGGFVSDGPQSPETPDQF